MALAYFIKSIENLQFGVYNGAPAEISLTKGQDYTNCVPIHTFYSTSDQTIWARTFPYLYMKSGPKLGIARGNIFGTQWCDANVIEFDDTYIKVQRNTSAFQHSKQDTYTEKAQLVGDVIIDDPVDPSRTIIFTQTQGTDGEDDWDHHNATYYLMPDNQEIRWQRSFDESFGSNLKGYWWAVEALDYSIWDVHHSDEISIGAAESTVYYDVPQDAPWLRRQSNSIIIASYRGGTNESTAPDRNVLDFDLIGSGNSLQVKITRSTSQAQMYARLQVVTSPYFSVQRGQMDFAYDDTSLTAAINTVDTATSVVWTTYNGGAGNCDYNAGGLESQAFTRFEISDVDEITGTTLEPGDSPGEGKPAPFVVISLEGDSPGFGTTTTTTTTTTSTFPYLDWVVPDEDLPQPLQFLEYYENGVYWTPGTGMSYSFYDWDWESYTLDVQPSDWTRRDTYGESGPPPAPPYFHVESKATPLDPPYDDRVLKIRSGNAWLMACTPDDPGQLLDTETVALLTQNTTNNNGGAILHARLQGSPQYRTFYKAELYNTNKFRIHKWVGGTPYFIAEITKSYSVDTWYWMKLQVSGTNPVALKAKFWEYGTAEPGWDIDTTDSAANRIQTAGWHGPSDYSNAGVGPSPYTDTDVAYYSISEDLSGGAYYYVSGSDGYIDVTGSWPDDYRPTKIRLTGTHDVAGTWTVELHDQSDNTIATVTFPQSASEQTVEADITWAGSGSSYDIKELYLASATDGQISNIEFEEEFASWSKEGVNESEFYPGLDNTVFKSPYRAIGEADDEDGIYGIDGQVVQLGFEEPDFIGNASAIRLAVRGKNAYDDGVSAEIWQGSTKLGDADIASFGHFYSNRRSDWIEIDRYASQLDDLQVKLTAQGSEVHTWISELQIEFGGEESGSTISTTTTTTTTTTTAPEPGWEQQFFPEWTCQSNCTWDGDSFNVAGPGLVIVPNGTWHQGYRPSKIRITATHNLGVPWHLQLSWGSGYTDIYIPVGSVAEADIIGQDADFTSISDLDAPGVGQIENIEFFFGEEGSTTTTTTTTTAPEPEATTTTTTTTTTTLPDWNPDLTFDYEVDVLVDVPSDSLLQQRVGFSVEGEMRPLGWKWDEMIWSKDQHRHDVVLPTLFDPDISTIPQSSWQSGIGHNLDLKIHEIIEDPGLGHPWRPLIRPGHYFIGPENFYLFSPNYVTRFGSDETTGGLSKIDLSYMPKQGAPMLVAFMHRDDDGATRDIDHFRKRVRFTGKTTITQDASGNLVSRQEEVHLNDSGDVVNYNIKNLPTAPEQRGLEYVLVTRPEAYIKEYLPIAVGKGEATLISFNLGSVPVDGPAIDFTNDDIFQTYVEDQVPVNEGEYSIGYSGSTTIPEGQVQVVTSDRDQLPGYVTYWSDYPATILFNDYYVRRIGFSEWGDAPPGYNETEPGIEFVETADYLGESSAQPNQVFYLSYFPIVDFTTLQVFVYDPRNEVVTEWTRVDDIEAAGPDDEVFTISPDGGFILFGDGKAGKIPHIHAYIAACYDYVPYVQYMPDEDWRLIEPTEVNLQPLFNSTHRGFVYLSHKELSVDSLLLQTNRSRVPDRAETYGPISAGNDYALLTCTAFDKDGGSVPDVDINWKLNPSMGYINGASPLYTRVSTTTDSSGKTRVVYTPVRTAGDMGTTVYLFDGLGNPLDNIKTTYIANDTLELSEFVEANVEDIYVFMVLDDDPLQPYDPYTRTGGRRVILYRYDEDTGDYELVRPTSVINKDNIVFDYSLPTPSTYPNLVQYDVITDRIIEAKATTVNPMTGLLIESNPIKFYIDIPESQKGVYTLPTATDRTGSTLDSAVYLTIDRMGTIKFIFDAEDSIDPMWSFTTTTTTTTTAPGGLYFVPDADDSQSGMSTFGSGTGHWDRLNSGINGGTPDETNGIYGLNGGAYSRLQFEDPSFPGTSTNILVHVRAKDFSGGPTNFRVRLYSDGVSEDDSDIFICTGSYQNFTLIPSTPVTKTAAQLTNLEVRLEPLDGSFDTQFAEVEIEIVL